jgi:hypothetical protein
VVREGRLVGLWRMKARGRKAELAVEKIGRLAKADVADEARRIAEVRGSADVTVVVD